MAERDQRKFERVETHVKVKLPGDVAWVECIDANVSGGGLLFESAKQLNQGDFVNLQFMLQARSGTLSNVHFFASARVVRIAPKNDGFQIAVEFVIDEEVRKEILKLIEMIKSQNLKIERPTALDALLRKTEPE